MKNIEIKKIAKIATIILTLTMLVTAVMVVVFVHNGSNAYAVLRQEQTLCSITREFVVDDYTIYDTTRIEDSFADDTILLVMTRREVVPLESIRLQTFLRLD